MKKGLLLLLILSVCTLRAEMEVELTENVKLKLGADVRSRYEGYTQGAAQPDADKDGRHATEYLRVRTRLWSTLDFGEDMTVNLRLGNRIHYVTTSPNKRNNNGRSTWEFPDEVYLDAANVSFNSLLDGKLKLTLGRQNLAFGNGMIFCEGTPFDQGRSLFNDGAVAVMKLENDTVSAFVLYDQWKDRAVFINDRNRRLRSGDIFTSGIYWTHKFSDYVNLDAYYMFNDIKDDYPNENEVERGHFADSSANLHTMGLRVFGKPFNYLDYSLENAWQFGHLDEHQAIQASMLDARVNVYLRPESKVVKPKLTFNFTRFSGDDSSTGRYEGWIPLMTQAPLWGDELLPIMLNGNWTNLNSLRTAFSCSPMEKLLVAVAATEYFADDSKAAVACCAPTGHGSHFGLLLNLAAEYKVNANLAFGGQISRFMAGEYFANGQDSTWARLEMTVSF